MDPTDPDPQYRVELYGERAFIDKIPSFASEIIRLRYDSNSFILIHSFHCFHARFSLESDEHISTKKPII